MLLYFFCHLNHFSLLKKTFFPSQKEKKQTKKIAPQAVSRKSTSLPEDLSLVVTAYLVVVWEKSSVRFFRASVFG